MRYLIIILIILTPLFSFSEEPSLADAQKAYQDGKHLKAYEMWRSLADRGDIVAMNNLGFLYEQGVVVNKNLNKSLDYYRKSAESGFPTAQYNMGEAYAEGRGVEKNNVTALKWFILAGTRGDKDAINYYEKIFDTMTKEEVKKANTLAKNWRTKIKKE